MPVLTGKRGKAALDSTRRDDAAALEMSGWGERMVSRAADQRSTIDGPNGVTRRQTTGQQMVVQKRYRDKAMTEGMGKRGD